MTSLRSMAAEAVSKASADPMGNYIERGLAEIEKKDETKIAFNSRNGTKYLASQLVDLFAAGLPEKQLCFFLECIFLGTDTTATMGQWCLLYLLHYPEWQTKIYEEVSALTNGNSRYVELSDKEGAHLTNAFIEEVHY